MDKTRSILVRADVKDRLISLINQIAKVPVDQIQEDATVDNQLQMQSVAFVELQVAIEEEFEVQIDPIRVVELNRFGNIVDYIYECVTSGAG